MLYYIVALNPGLDGIRMAKLGWTAPERGWQLKARGNN